MVGARTALIVASYDYEDPGLSRLRAPARDAEALAEVLSDPVIGGFEVRTILNEPAHVVNLAVEEFFTGRSTDDLLLLHFSCHGVKDETGDLYFAAANTRLGLLGATAVSADFVNRRMNRTRSRRVVLLLDCCYAGAFERGMTSKGGTSLDLEERLGGRGRAVITASTAMEYAFEGEQLADSGDVQPSVFTSALVEGLRTGDADKDLDGMIGLDELYDYVFDRVRATTPHQTPSKWEFGFQGELNIARRSQPPTTAAPLPAELREALDNAFVGVRSGAVQELERLINGRHIGLALAAREALTVLTTDDSLTVRAAAESALLAAPPPELPAPWASGSKVDAGGVEDAEEVEEVEDAEQVDEAEVDEVEQVGETEQVDQAEQIDQAEQVDQAEQDTATIDEPGETTESDTTTSRDETDTTLSGDDDESRLPPPPPFYKRWWVVAGAAAAVLVIAAAAAIVFGDNGGGSDDGDDVAALTTETLIVPEREAGSFRLVAVDSVRRVSDDLAAGTLPTISPNRQHIIYLLPTETGAAEPWIMAADGSDAHRFFAAGGPCTYSNRPAWSESGHLLAVVCVDEEGDPMSDLYVFTPDGELDRVLETRGVPDGAPTWVGDDALVYSGWQSDPEEKWALWSFDTLESPATRVRTGSGGSESHPDWSPDQQRLLFLRSDPPGAPGDIWTIGASGKAEPWSVDQSLAHPTWSPDGSAIAFVVDNDTEKILEFASFDDPDPSAWRRLPVPAGTVPGPPAWGSR